MNITFPFPFLCNKLILIGYIFITQESEIHVEAGIRFGGANSRDGMAELVLSLRSPVANYEIL